MENADADKECVRSLTREKCAVTEFVDIMKSDVLPILEKSMVREKYDEVVSKFDMLENELHMRKKEENLEEVIDKLEKAREDVEEEVEKIERMKEAMEHIAQGVREIQDDFMVNFARMSTADR